MGGVFKAPKSKTQRLMLQKAIMDEQEARKENLRRPHRGMEATIRTSNNGLLGGKEQNLKRKQLLGE